MNILITGANRGIGLEMVKIAVSKRWRVFACCRNPIEAEKLSEVAMMSAGLVSVYPLDVTDVAQIQALAYELRHESIDILYNSAGVYGSMNHMFGNTDRVDWLKTFEINTVAPMKVAEHFVENVARSNRKIMVFMTSKMGSMFDNGSGGSYIYRSSKAALNAVVTSMAIDLQDKGITCLLTHPGWVKTEMGGPHAEITTRESVTRLFDIVENSTLEDSGKFFDIDGSIIPW